MTLTDSFLSFKYFKGFHLLCMAYGLEVQFTHPAATEKRLLPHSVQLEMKQLRSKAEEQCVPRCPATRQRRTCSRVCRARLRDADHADFNHRCNQSLMSYLLHSASVAKHGSEGRKQVLNQTETPDLSVYRHSPFIT